jgi:selenocysteine lyase/cysteine desulfurase
MSNRRNFLHQLATLGIGSAVLPWLPDKASREMLAKHVRKLEQVSAAHAATDEEFWNLIQLAFRQSSQFLNLENGYFSPQPTRVLEAQEEYIRRINETPAFYMRTQMETDREEARARLAGLAGCSPEEIAITRNTTESLDTIIAGIDFEPGQEAIMSNQDYGSMVEAFHQQKRRRGLVCNIIDLPMHPANDSEIVERYEQAITDRTRIMLVTHLINITGQVLPVKKIADMARSRGVEVMVDGAHSFAQLEFNIPDLGCDYFGASLHKWLCCPLGAGILYVRKDRIKNVWPLFGDVSKSADDIRKFEHYGTHPAATTIAISDAIRFHELIGPTRKQDRLRYLKAYWTSKIKDIPGVRLNTPDAPNRSSAIANIAIEGLTPHQLAGRLYDEFRIYTVAIDHPVVKGVRITPHLYTRLTDLEKLVEAIRQISESRPG